MKYVGVKFRDTRYETEKFNTKVYIYKTNLELKPDDDVVVETYKGPATAVVVETNTEMIKNICKELYDSDRAIKYVICKFDMSAVEEMRAYEAKIEFTKQKIRDTYRQKILNQMADEFVVEFPELKDSIEEMRALGELENLFGGEL